MRRILLCLPLLLVALATWALWLEPDSLRLHEESLSLMHWPAGQSGLRVAVIADLHAGSPWIDEAKVRRVVSLTNAARLDLVLLPGDFVIQSVTGGHFIPPEDCASWLSGLHAPLGVFATLGNHDQRLGARIRAAFDSAGIRVLDERSVHVSQGRFDFLLAGLADVASGQHVDLGRLRKAPTDLPPVLAFTHSPDLMPGLDAGVNLLVAGHTHGGQVRLPFYGALVTSSVYGKRYESGHVVEQTDLYVCPGIGTSILPIRFLDPPEICLLTLDGRDHAIPAATP